MVASSYMSFVSETQKHAVETRRIRDDFQSGRLLELREGEEDLDKKVKYYY